MLISITLLASTPVKAEPANSLDSETKIPTPFMALTIKGGFARGR
jgi:hypothetical protein